ncbi:MAG: Rrf2 family transcriptional regulator [Coriobacteriia bacterium]|nr:Rrf2 family transcriptional regulator [Coriobacteriia bacterium]
MRLTAKSEYGLLAMIELACCYGQGPVSARAIAERRLIPARFLEQLFAALRRADLVRAVRGAHGGFVLSRNPAEITVLQVVETLEGPLTASVCDTDRGLECEQAATCAAAPVWVRATSALREVFSSATLAGLCEAPDRPSLDEPVPDRTVDEAVASVTVPRPKIKGSSHSGSSGKRRLGEYRHGERVL